MRLYFRRIPLVIFKGTLCWMETSRWTCKSLEGLCIPSDVSHLAWGNLWFHGFHDPEEQLKMDMRMGRGPYAKELPPTRSGAITELGPTTEQWCSENFSGKGSSDASIRLSPLFPCLLMAMNITGRARLEQYGCGNFNNARSGWQMTKYTKYCSHL